MPEGIERDAWAALFLLSNCAGIRMGGITGRWWTAKAVLEVRSARCWRKADSNCWSPASGAISQRLRRLVGFDGSSGYGDMSGRFGGLYSGSLVHPARIKQSASSVDISTMRCPPMVICRPENVWTEPIPCGASRRTWTGFGGFSFSAISRE